MKRPKSWDALARRGRLLTFALRFCCRLERVLRFGPHGLILALIDALNHAAIAHNRQVDSMARERRRLSAIHRRGGVR